MTAGASASSPFSVAHIGAAAVRAADTHRRNTLLLCGIVAAYVIGAAAATLILGRALPLPHLTLGYLLLILPLPAFLLVLGALGVVRAHRRNQGGALRTAWNRWAAEHGLSSAASIALLPLFMAAFTSVKALIPAIQPFAAWDERLAGWDRYIHGADPWQLLQPLYDAPLLTFLLNALYYPIWFCVALGSWIYVATRSHPRRQQFLLSFLLLWILLGTVGGVSMSSAGPILYDRATGDPGRFADLLRSLATANESYPLIAMVARDRLWDAYGSGIVDIGTGISAMPSLHVAIATLCAIFAWCCDRRAGAIMTAYAAVILLASVHLGWHYAVDGYVSILGTIVIWWSVGWITRRKSVGALPSS